ncbi:MAG: DNA replication/repair protein RecF, partial [Deltaproteobacteria bacterium]|nr:DNA replication/repair protein RecF [Deltaproteobacteria bacterium]
MTEPLAITALALRDLRIVRELTLQPCPSLNVVSGENGQGKTTLLEAIYLALTSRSFRTERPRELLREGAESGVVRVRVAEGSLEREQRAVVTERGRAVTLDGKRPATLGGYATRSPVVVFQPGDLGLLAGPAAARRTLLDR